MAADDRVDLLDDGVGQVDNLAVAAVEAPAVAEGTGVGDDDHHVGPAGAQRPRAFVHHARRVGKAQPHDVGRLGRGRRLHRRHADDADLHALHVDERVVANPWDVAAGAVGHVGTEDGVRRLAHAGLERIDPPVELVIA